jgi:mono/diheme cytochrome c family protein
MKSHTEIFCLTASATATASPPKRVARRWKAEATGAVKERSRWLPPFGGRSVALAIAALTLIGAAGCRQDMHNQPKYRALRGTDFFPDGASARPQVEGTVARGTLGDNEAFFTGKVANVTVKELPFKVDDAVVTRGQERFNIFCTPCHDATGSGRGMVVQRGYKQPPSFHDDRLRNADAGYFFDVMTNGFGAMPDYKMQLSARDRWAVVAYIRALQLSQHAATTDIPGGDPVKAGQAAEKPAAGHGPAKH